VGACGGVQQHLGQDHCGIHNLPARIWSVADVSAEQAAEETGWINHEAGAITSTCLDKSSKYN